MWDDPDDDERVISWGRSFRDSLRAHSTGATYLNFTVEEGAARLRSQYLPTAHERVTHIKARWGPEDVFHAGGHLPPSRARAA